PGPASPSRETLELPAPPQVTRDLPASVGPLPPPHPASAAGSAGTLPARIGRFEVRRFLGEGGFGRVYEAYDPSLKRQVALKVARPEQMQTPERVGRFQREARAAGNLMHPHVVAVFDSGHDGPHQYIATAFAPGRPLDSVLAEHENGRDARPAAAL